MPKLLNRAGEAVAAALIPASGSVSAEVGSFETGNSLYTLCSVPMGSYEDGACGSYVEGVHSRQRISNAINDTSSVCIPLKSTRKRMMDVTMQFLAAHPETGHFAAVNVVVQALADGFPCKPGKRQYRALHHYGNRRDDRPRRSRQRRIRTGDGCRSNDARQQPVLDIREAVAAVL